MQPGRRSHSHPVRGTGPTVLRTRAGQISATRRSDGGPRATRSTPALLSLRQRLGDGSRTERGPRPPAGREGPPSQGRPRPPAARGGGSRSPRAPSRRGRASPSRRRLAGGCGQGAGAGPDCLRERGEPPPRTGRSRQRGVLLRSRPPRRPASPRRAARRRVLPAPGGSCGVREDAVLQRAGRQCGGRGEEKEPLEALRE